MSDVKFSCPSCGQHIKCDESHIGENLPCPGCAVLVRVPPNAELIIERPVPVDPMTIPTLEENFIAEDTGAALPAPPPVTQREQQIAAARAARAEAAPVVKPRLSFILSGGKAPAREENESATTTAGQIHHANEHHPSDDEKSHHE